MTIPNTYWRAYMKLSELGPDVLSAKDLQKKLSCLTSKELEAVTTLISEGWQGSLEELIQSAKEQS